MTNPITLSVIKNAIGFEYIAQTGPERVVGDDVVHIDDKELKIISAMADRVYAHLSEGGFLHERSL